MNALEAVGIRRACTLKRFLAIAAELGLDRFGNDAFRCPSCRKRADTWLGDGVVLWRCAGPAKHTGDIIDLVTAVKEDETTAVEALSFRLGLSHRAPATPRTTPAQPHAEASNRRRSVRRPSLPNVPTPREPPAAGDVVCGDSALAELLSAINDLRTAVERLSPAPPVDASPELLTVAEVAHWLRTTPKGIYAMVSRSELPGTVRLGRRLLFRQADVNAWLGSRSGDNGFANGRRRGRGRRPQLDGGVGGRPFR